LDLIETYPELNYFLTRDKNGVLGLNYNKKNLQGDTVQDIVDNYEDNVSAAKVAEQLAKGRQAKAQSDVDFKNFEHQWHQEVRDQPSVRFDRDSTDALAKAFALNQVEKGANGEWLFNKWLADNGYEANVVKNLNTEQLRTYGNQLINNERAEKNSYATAAVTAMQMASLNGATGDYVRAMDEDILSDAM
jgi:hypothetical protein